MNKLLVVGCITCTLAACQEVPSHRVEDAGIGGSVMVTNKKPGLLEGRMTPDTPDSFPSAYIAATFCEETQQVEKNTVTKRSADGWGTFIITCE